MSSKSKKKYSNIIPAWLSAKRDNQEGRFIQVGNSLLLSEKYQSLTPGARHLYLCIQPNFKDFFRLKAGAAGKNFAVVRKKNGGHLFHFPNFHQGKGVVVRLYVYESDIVTRGAELLQNGHKRQAVGAGFPAHFHTAKPF